MGGEIAAVEIAGGALVEIEEIGVVDPFEIEQMQDRLAHADIGEDRPARVEHQAVHALGQAVGEFFLDHAPLRQRRKIVSRLPAARIGLHAQVVEAFLERLEMRVAVAVIVEADGIEIPQAAVDRQIAPPIIRIAREADAFARLDRTDAIGTAAEQRRECRLLEFVGIDRVLGQHRHQADDQRQFAVVGAGKIEAHRALSRRHRLDHLGVVGAEVRPAAVAQQLPRKRSRRPASPVCRRQSVPPD